MLTATNSSEELTAKEYAQARIIAYFIACNRGSGREPPYDPAAASADFCQAAGQVISNRRPSAVSMWVFGYGSLMWDGWQSQYGCLCTVKATLQGFRRIFNKASVRNWGTRKAPCPTLNITETVGGSCVGLAFEFPEDSRAVIIAALGSREGLNFKFEEREIVLECGRHVQAVIPRYDGPNLTHDKSPVQLAAMARLATGTEGQCAAYVNNLATMLAKLGIDDPAVRELSQAVLRTQSSS